MTMSSRSVLSSAGAKARSTTFAPTCEQSVGAISSSGCHHDFRLWSMSVDGGFHPAFISSSHAIQSDW